MSIHTDASESIRPRLKLKNLDTLSAYKRQGKKIASLTCYDYSTARILDQAGVDMLLVGDSLAMTVLGHPNTLSVTVDEMLHHAKAVVRGTQQALVVADLPFMSYQVDPVQAVYNAGRFIQEAQAQAVKLEGASERILQVVRHLVEIGIPVIGHLGLTPQMINTLGGFKVQGKHLDDVKALLRNALALQQAGVSAIVLEMVPVEVASLLTAKLQIPTIGIGAGNGCDGQILVIDDLLGRYDALSPRFVRRYLDSTQLIQQAVTQYAADIQSGDFPNNQTEAFAFPAEHLEALFDWAQALE